MTREPFIAHSELTNEIYIVTDKEKYRVTEQVIKAVMAIKALEQEPTERIEYGTDGNAYRLTISNGKEFKQEPILDKIKAEIRQLPSYVAKFAGGAFAIHIDKEKVLQIIDKYKGEENETNN